MTKFVDAYEKATGKKRRIPSRWVGHPVLGEPFELAPSERARQNAGGLGDQGPDPQAGATATGPDVPAAARVPIGGVDRAGKPLDADGDGLIDPSAPAASGEAEPLPVTAESSLEELQAYVLDHDVPLAEDVNPDDADSLFAAITAHHDETAADAAKE